MSSRFTHVVTCVRMPFLFEAERCSVVCIPHSAIPSSVSGHPSCFRSGCCEQRSCRTLASGCAVSPEVEWPGWEHGLWSQRDSGLNPAATLGTHCGNVGAQEVFRRTVTLTWPSLEAVLFFQPWPQRTCGVILLSAALGLPAISWELRATPTFSARQPSHSHRPAPGHGTESPLTGPAVQAAVCTPVCPPCPGHMRARPPVSHLPPSVVIARHQAGSSSGLEPRSLQQPQQSILGWPFSLTFFGSEHWAGSLHARASVSPRASPSCGSSHAPLPCALQEPTDGLGMLPGTPRL